MLTVSIQEAQSRLPELIRGLGDGAQLVITDESQPIATLSRTNHADTWPCRAGSAKGAVIWMAPDFDAPLEDMREYME